jgi:hypothetical protein
LNKLRRDSEMTVLEEKEVLEEVVIDHTGE